VNAAIRNQSEEMQLPSAHLCLFHGPRNSRVLLKCAGRNLRVDARNVHLHNAPRADVQVADLAVAHLPVGQPHKVVRGLNQRVGILGEQLVVGGLLSQRNGVVGGFGAIAPSVEDGQ
jgi:hypothetical protein